jgi:hypothetical protein
MSSLETLVRADGQHTRSNPTTPLSKSLRFRWRLGGAALILLTLANVPAALGWGGKVRLARKYRAGQTTVYATEVRTHAQIDSHPPELKSFFPPVPADLAMRQQNTVTVAAVHEDGAADVQQRFDRFELQSDLSALPEELRDSAKQAQREFSQQMSGHTLTVHYDREGRLVGFEGADSLLQQLDAPLREPLHQMLRLFLEQMGGQALYPDHPVKRGEEWTQKLDAEPQEAYAFQVQGSNTLHYSGKTRYHGIKAGIVEYHFENTLIPAEAGMRKGGALPLLEAMGMKLKIQISGQGKGQVLVALDDGRVLQNHSTLHQTLSAHMEGKGGLPLPTAQPAKLEIQSDTEMNVEGNAK